MMNFKKAISVVLVAAGAVWVASMPAYADPPGYVYLALNDRATMVVELNDRSAIVVQPPGDQASATITRPETKLPEETVAAMAAGARPIGSSIILSYRGRLYLLPTKN